MHEPTETKTRRLLLRLDETAHAVIVRAITLRLAMSGDTSSDDPELRGHALAHVCRDWMRVQADLLREAAP